MRELSSLREGKWKSYVMPGFLNRVVVLGTLLGESGWMRRVRGGLLVL